jgi:mono/diheme cytochrome c family protein
MRTVWGTVFAASLVAALSVGSALAQTQSAVDRGRYLVNTIMTCGNCHTPKGPGGDLADKALAGGLRFDEPPFDVTASNITPDRDTGIGGWSDAAIKKALREGVRPNGVRLAEVMPSGFYGIITESDLDAIVAYLRTLPAVQNKLPDPIFKRAITQGIARDGRKMLPPMGYGYYAAMTEDDLDALVAWLRTVPPLQ